MDESLNKDFLDAVNRGHTSLVREMIFQGANIEIRDDKGQTPLLMAVSKGYLELARTLIEAGCDPKARDHNNQNALHKAILYEGSSSENIIRELLDTKRVEYDLKDAQDKSPLEYAKERWPDPKGIYNTLEEIFDAKCQDLLQAEDFGALFSDQDLVIYLIKKGSSQIFDLINQGLEINANAPGTCYSKNPLYYAFRGGHKDLFKKLIDLGADIASLEMDVNLPLNYTSLKAECDMLSILIERGFNINAQDEQGRSALHLALEYRPKDTAEALINMGCDVNLPDKEGRYPLHKVMDAKLDPKDKIFLIDLLIEHKAKVKVIDKYGKNPLHTAMGIYYIKSEEKIDILNKLLANGIDINDRDCYGQTAFRKALDVYLNAEKPFQHENDLDILNALLINGADINIPDNTRNTFDTIIQNGPVGRWAWGLLEHVLNRAEVNNPNHLGQNLLHIAAKQGNVDAQTLRNLSEKYPDAALCQDNEGRTPLHLVVGKGGVEDCLVFLKKFPDLVHVPDNHGRIPLHYIGPHYILHEAKNIAKLLIEYGSNINTPDKSDETPADKAAASFLFSLLEELLDKGATFKIKEEFSGKIRNLLHYAIKHNAPLTALYLIKNDFDILQENNEGLNPLSLAIEHDQTIIASALIDKDKDSLPISMSKGKVPLDYAIKKKNLKVIAKLIDYAPIDLKQLENLITTIDKTDQVGSMRIMIKLFDPKTNVIAQGYDEFGNNKLQPILIQINKEMDQFKEQVKEYDKLEDLRDIIKSLKNIIKNPDYFDFFDKKEELLKLCQDLLPFVNKEYAELSQDHFNHLLSKSGLDNSDANIIENTIGYLKYNGHKLLEVSKSGIAIEGLIKQTYPVQYANDVPNVQEAGAFTEEEVPVTT